MGEKKITTVDDLKKAYIQLKKDYDNLYFGMLQMYQKLTNDTENIMYIYDPRSGDIFVNQKGIELLGLPATANLKGLKSDLLQYVDEASKEEFIHMHKMIRKGEAKEISGIVKLCQKSGEKAVYEHKLIALFDAGGSNTGVCFGSFHDVTERYIKDMRLERYYKLVKRSVSFDFTYDQKMDKLRVVIPEDGRQENWPNEKSFYFWSKLIKEEKVCPKSDIPVLLEFLHNGSAKAIQIQLFEPNEGDYRWYALSGELENTTVKGKIVDITDYKDKVVEHERLEKVLECLNKNYVLIAQVDLKEDSYEMLLLDRSDFIVPVADVGCFSELHSFLSNYIKPPYVDMYKQFGAIEQLRDMLQTKNRIECEFEITDHEKPWRIEVIQVLEYDEAGEPSQLVLSHAIADKIEVRNQSENEIVNQSDNMELKEIRANVLLAEDYVLNAEYARYLLEEEGIQVKWVQNGTEAVQTMISAAQGQYDFILMDTKMPQMDGFEATRKIRELHAGVGANIPIIGMSLQDNTEVEQKAAACGMTDHIEKPISNVQIHYLLKKYVNHE